MASRIERATLAHAEAVESALLRELNPELSSAVWRRLFEPRWSDASLPLGSVLLDDGRVVGFASYIHAQLPRPLGPDAALCNISTWVTAPSHASQALSLVMPVLKLRDVTITNITPTASVGGIFSKLGFKTLEQATLLLRPAPWLRSEWSRAGVETELSRILPKLPEWERRVAEAHAGLVDHLWIEGPAGRYLYAQYLVVQRRKLRTAKLLWCTPGVLAEASLTLRRALGRTAGSWLVEVDERVAGAALPQATRLPIDRLFRSTTLAAAEVPAAYSELALLGSLR